MSEENGLEQAAGYAKENMQSQRSVDDAMRDSKALIEKSTIAMVGSIGSDNYPNIKAMLKIETEGLKTVWFFTNTSSLRATQFRRDPKACVYFTDIIDYKGLMLVGEMEVLTDLESRKRLWREGFEVYCPLGVNDPDYTVFRFTAKWGNYYHGLCNTNFNL